MASENKSTAFLLGKDPHHYTSAPTSDTDDESVPDHSDHLLSQRNSLCKRSFPYIIHFLLILSYSLIFAISWSRNAPRDSLGIPYVDTVFEVNPKLNRSIARIYTGPPSDDLDEAWDNLLQCQTIRHRKDYSLTDMDSDANVRVPEQTIRDLDRLDQAVRFTDGSGYFAQMTAYHHLHCIVRFMHLHQGFANQNRNVFTTSSIASITGRTPQMTTSIYYVRTTVRQHALPSELL